MARRPPNPRWPERERLVVDETEPVTRPVVVEEDDTVVAPAPVGPPPPIGPPEPVDPRGRWMSDHIGIAMILILVLVALAAAVIAAIILTRDDNNNSGTTTTVVATTPARTVPAAAAPVAVPSFVGRTESDARAALERAGFRVVVSQVPGPPPAGRVLAQNPPTGQTLRRGQLVRLNVSDGSKKPATSATTTTKTTTQPAATPGAATTTQTTQATTTTPTTTTETTTTTQTTQTSASPQQPAPAQPAKPARPTTVETPSLSGDVKSAVQQLAAAGLLASVQYVPGDEPLGTVKAQSPPSGSSVKSDSHVTVSVSSGPGEKEMETVPDVSGQRVTEAVQTLNRSGLRLILLRRQVSDRSEAGRIVDQTPQPGAHAPKNAQVVVYMGAYRPG